MSRIVLKVGGAVAEDAATLARALAREHELCVVHGAGPQISAELERAGLEVRFVDGRRVTSAAALSVVRDSFGAVNAGVCAAIGLQAVPLFGDEIGLDAVRVPELGYVGSPVPSSPPAIEEALAAGLVPVVAPLAVGPLNVNADSAAAALAVGPIDANAVAKPGKLTLREVTLRGGLAAAALAVGLGADRLLFVTDVPGLLLGGAVASSIHVAEAERLLSAGALGGGIVPKLHAAVAATRGGVDATIGATAVVA